jgi:hypothetical protein
MMLLPGERANQSSQTESTHAALFHFVVLNSEGHEERKNDTDHVMGMNALR